MRERGKHMRSRAEASKGKPPTFRTEGDRNGVGELVDAGGEPAAAGLAGRYNLDVCPHHQAAAGDDPGRPGQPLQG